MPTPENLTASLARAAKAIEALDTNYPGRTTQEAATEFLHDLLHLETQESTKLHFIGALEDARLGYEGMGMDEPTEELPLEAQGKTAAAAAPADPAPVEEGGTQRRDEPPAHEKAADGETAAAA